MTQKDSVEQRLLQWLFYGERGTSSNTIAAVLSGAYQSDAGGRQDVPYDPADFRRCHLLLEAIPEFRSRMGELGEALPYWRPMADAWDELTALYRAEVGGHEYAEIARAPKLYDRMKQLIAECRAVDDPDMVVEGDWRIDIRNRIAVHRPSDFSAKFAKVKRRWRTSLDDQGIDFKSGGIAIDEFARICREADLVINRVMDAWESEHGETEVDFPSSPAPGAM